MTRKDEFEKVKDIITKNTYDLDCGLFFSANTVGDPMETVFSGTYFTIKICENYDYYEVFGCNEEEANLLHEIYYGKEA